MPVVVDYYADPSLPFVFESHHVTPFVTLALPLPRPVVVVGVVHFSPGISPQMELGFDDVSHPLDRHRFVHAPVSYDYVVVVVVEGVVVAVAAALVAYQQDH